MRRSAWILTLSLLGVAHTAQADPTLTPSAETTPAIVMVYLESGDSIQAIRVQPASVDMLRIGRLDGTEVFLPSNHVARVVDERGTDRTKDALDRRKLIGIPPPGKPRWTESGSAGPSRFLHYGPRSITKSFGITETSAFTRAEGGVSGERSYSIAFDLGRMVNVTDRTAMGGTLFLSAGSGADFGVRARFRRWISDRSALDISPGVIFFHDEPDNWEGRGLGLVGEAVWSYSRTLGIAAQVYSVRRTRSPYWWVDPEAADLEDRDTGLMLGLKIGGRQGVFSAIGASVVGLVVAANQPRDNPVTVP